MGVETRSATGKTNSSVRRSISSPSTPVTLSSLSKAIAGLQNEITTLKQRNESLQNQVNDLLPLVNMVEELHVTCIDLKNEVKNLSPKVQSPNSVPELICDFEGGVWGSTICDKDKDKNKMKKIKKKIKKGKRKDGRLFNTKEQLNIVHSNVTTSHNQQTLTNTHTNAHSTHRTSDRNKFTPKWKWHHLSTIVPLTADYVRQWVSNRLGGAMVKCFSLTTPLNPCSKTFKLGVPVECSRRLYDKGFWPIGSVLRDFGVRKNFPVSPYIDGLI